ncbi:hypothetical protein BMS3Abin08_01470 [bacterium BMS3Abin08]|nr:hypothetical protein BMS3Abin08_01470 [bacterium BMS3Abin08]
MQLDLLFSFQRPGLKMWQEGYISTFLYQSHPFLLVLSFVGIYQAVRKKDFRVLIPLWFFILVVALSIKRIRYIIPLLPLFSILSAYGLSFLKRREIRRYLVLLTVTSSLVLLYIAYIPFLKDTSMVNLKRAGEFLNSTGADSCDGSQASWLQYRRPQPHGR